jgi:hypothetical protein
MDLVEELNALKNASHSNGFDFYSAVSQLFNRLEDFHTQFIAPCGQIQRLPFEFEIHKNESGSTYFVTARVGSDPNVTAIFINQTGLNLTGAEIVDLHLGDNDSYIENKPHLTLATWADKYIGLSRCSATRLNYALHSYLGSHIIGTYPVGLTINITYKLNETESKTITMPYYVHIHEKVTDLLAICHYLSTNLTTPSPSPHALHSPQRTTATTAPVEPSAADDDEVSVAVRRAFERHPQLLELLRALPPQPSLFDPSPMEKLFREHAAPSSPDARLFRKVSLHLRHNVR